MRYQSGDKIQRGDKILLHGEPGVIEFIVEALNGDPALDWYLKEHGPGVMVVDPNAGRTFISDTESAEDLQFVSRS